MKNGMPVERASMRLLAFAAHSSRMRNRRRAGGRPYPTPLNHFPLPPSNIMPAEFDLYGVYIPRLLVLMLVTLFAVIILRRLLAWIGAYTLVWHRGLFDFALYILLLGAVSSVSRWYFT